MIPNCVVSDIEGGAPGGDQVVDGFKILYHNIADIVLQYRQHSGIILFW